MTDAPISGVELVEKASEAISPDTVALYALQGLLASGIDASVAVAAVWTVAVPDFMMERDKYWSEVARSGSFNPPLQDVANYTLRGSGFDYTQVANIMEARAQQSSEPDASETSAQ